MSETTAIDAPEAQFVIGGRVYALGLVNGHRRWYEDRSSYRVGVNEVERAMLQHISEVTECLDDATSQLADLRAERDAKRRRFDKMLSRLRHVL